MFSSVNFFLCWLLSIPHLCTSFPDFPFPVFLALSWWLLCYIANLSGFFLKLFWWVSFLMLLIISILWLLPYFSLVLTKTKSPWFEFTLSLSFGCSDPFLKWTSGFFSNKSSDATPPLLPPPCNTQWIKVTTKGDKEKDLWWHKWAAALLWLP